jgi:hypothetical protein
MHALKLLLILLICSVPAMADGLPAPLPPEWNVTGALLLVGNDVCAGLPCTESVAFSFDLGYQPLGFGFGYEAYFTNFRDSGSGALGTFTEQGGSGESFVNAERNHIGLGLPVGTEIDLHLSVFVEPAPVAPTVVFADLYTCFTSTCATDFAPPEFSSLPLPINGVMTGAIVQSTVTTTPEPATLTLLVSGIFLLGLGGAVSRKF